MKAARKAAATERRQPFAMLDVDWTDCQVPQVKRKSSMLEAGLPLRGNVPTIVNLRIELTKEMAEDRDAFPGSFHESMPKSGRGAKFLNKGRDVAMKHAEFIAKKHSQIKVLAPAESSWLAAPWWFGYTAKIKSAGPEFGFFGSVNWQGAGHRKCLFVKVEDLVTHIEKTMNSTAQKSLQNLTNYFGEACSLDINMLNLC